MYYFAFYRLLRRRWRRLARVFWPGTLREQLQAELKHLDGELARRHQRLLKCRQKIEDLRIRLQRRVYRMALLVSQVHDGTAARAVEELAYKGQAIDRLRERLHARESAYAERLALFHHRKQQRAAVRAQLLSCPPGQRLDKEEESDTDYPF